ncbi:MAG: hypothetical protein NTV87_16230 [Ignavibacteriae bacterium]|nr:hypothetical protein [Ignavibacteriota bacterium]
MLNIIRREYLHFQKIRNKYPIVNNSIPILWFGDIERYYSSKKRIVTVSLNPSSNEFKLPAETKFSYKYRFPDFKPGDSKSLYIAYNNYYEKPSCYKRWFDAGYGMVLKGFSASYYDGENIAVHTDIGSQYATNPNWSKLSDDARINLENIGLETWHKLMKILEPDVILFSASRGYQEKIERIFKPIEPKWVEKDVKSDTPLLIRRFNVNDKIVCVFFQVQGRKPFLRTSKEEKLKFANYLIN